MIRLVMAFWKLLTSNCLAQVPYFRVWLATFMLFCIWVHRGRGWCHGAQEFRGLSGQKVPGEGW
jgi:hypothetical protein